MLRPRPRPGVKRLLRPRLMPGLLRPRRPRPREMRRPLSERLPRRRQQKRPPRRRLPKRRPLPRPLPPRPPLTRRSWLPKSLLLLPLLLLLLPPLLLPLLLLLLPPLLLPHRLRLRPQPRSRLRPRSLTKGLVVLLVLALSRVERLVARFCPRKSLLPELWTSSKSISRLARCIFRSVHCISSRWM